LRLKLNEQLKNEKLLPLEIKRTTRSKSGTQEIVSKLIVNYSLSIDDNKEIVRVTGMVNDYKIVAAKEFFARK
jgi:retron-type reverse transcriptase